MVTGGTEETFLRWIPLLPLLAALFHGVILGVVRRPVPRWVVVAISCGSITFSFVIACVVFGQLLQLPDESRVLVDNLYTWIGAGVGNAAVSSELAFALDPLSAVMVLVVSGVGALIHFYSIGYMGDDHRDDKGFQRFFCYLNLFAFAMLVLVLADNFVLMFLGWEGVGLCSYLLTASMPIAAARPSSSTASETSPSWWASSCSSAPSPRPVTPRWASRTSSGTSSSSRLRRSRFRTGCPSGRNGGW